MTHAEIVATYTTTALQGIVRDLARARGEWEEQRYKAAKAELQIRQSHNLQQDQESLL
jgi:hypothetical protein